MYVAVVVTVCHLLANGALGVCEDVVAADTDTSEGLTWTGCMLTGQVGVAAWKANSREFSGDDYRVTRWRCVPDRRFSVRAPA